MDLRERPLRSVLYIPGSRERACEKVKRLSADGIIFDLEDAVAAEEKVNARALLSRVLTTGDFAHRVKIARINGLDTQWGRDDAIALADVQVDAILIPKVNSPADVSAVAELVPNTPLWAMMESPLGILNAAAIAAHPRLTGMVLGTNDLAKDLGTRFRVDREPLLYSLQACLLAARAYGLICLDGVFNAFKNDAGLRVECEQGRDMGFDGKTVIHPRQIGIANIAFAPSEAEIDLARRHIEAFNEAERSGKGVAVVDGKIVENLHVVMALQTLAKAEAIEKIVPVSVGEEG